MFRDPVFQALHEYKVKISYDVIRYEYVLLAEIARCEQYAKNARTNTPSMVVSELKDTLKYIRSLRTAYLNLKFSEYLKTVPFWRRRALRADPGGWKYMYYCTERNDASKEVAIVVRAGLEVARKSKLKKGN